MKMSKWFKNKITLFGDTIEDNEFAYAVMSCEYEVDGVDAGVAMCHAVNNHDQLVEALGDAISWLAIDRQFEGSPLQEKLTKALQEAHGAGI